jgi:uncharacterized protein YdeI (YjbR/CyaY-like superfamily)
MNHTDPRVDNYIIKSADFAVPILVYLRELVHASCPEVRETMKWSFPHFEYKGSILCSMASFKYHCAFGFWYGSLLTDPHKLLATGEERNSMGSLGKIKSISDLPAAEHLTAFIAEVMQLIDVGTKVKKEEKPKEVKELVVPAYMLDALNDNPKALRTFDNFSYSQKKEYVEWLEDAKTEATRNKRLATAVGWMEEGKIRNWKYLRN